MTRVGVVDLGTNSTRLLVADVEDGEVREVDRRLEITRLGEAVDSRRQLLPEAIARVRNVLGDYRRIIEEHGAERTLAFATRAVRDAENGEAFLGEIEWSYGFETRLLTGHEEALLTIRGVSKPQTFAVEARLAGGVLEVHATTDFAWADYQMPTPNFEHPCPVTSWSQLRSKQVAPDASHFVAGRGISMRWNSSRCDE